MGYTPVFIVCVLGLVNFAGGQISTNKEDLLNWCINAINHKDKPGPEDILYEQCLPWKDRSCCTHNTTNGIHTPDMYNFKWDHCSEVKPMSNACRRHFIQDLCFYECEPNLGPWVVQVEMKIRKERAFGVPLCASDCDDWYNDCKDEFTCVENWARDFNWTDGRNSCPSNHICQPYSVIFKNSSKAFCESVWDSAWVYTSDDKPCMRLWFNGSEGNPNVKVAKLKLAEMYLPAVRSAAITMQLNYLCIVIITFAMVNFNYGR